VVRAGQAAPLTLKSNEQGPRPSTSGSVSAGSVSCEATQFPAHHHNTSYNLTGRTLWSRLGLHNVRRGSALEVAARFGHETSKEVEGAVEGAASGRFVVAAGDDVDRQEALIAQGDVALAVGAGHGVHDLLE
jgi:hypothetical protein